MLSKRSGCIDPSFGAVAVDEHCIGHAADIGFGHLVYPVELQEKLTPVAVAGLVLRQGVGQALVVGQAAQQVGAGAGLEHGQLIVADVGGLELLNFLVDGVAHLRRSMPRQGDGAEDEQAWIFVPGVRAEAFGDRGDLLVADQAAIETGDAAVGENIADGVVNGIVGVAVIRAVVALNVDGLGNLLNGVRLLGKLFGLDGGHLLRLGTGGNAAEIFFQHRQRLGGLDVADHGYHDVRSHVILLVEFHGLGGVDLAHFAGPADAAAAVRVGHVSGGDELLKETALGVGIGAHAALFDHHVALLVELAGHGVGQAAALEIGPEFKAVLRHGPEELGVVEAGFSVQAFGAVALGNVGELVGNDEFVRFNLGIYEFLL